MKRKLSEDTSTLAHNVTEALRDAKSRLHSLDELVLTDNSATDVCRTLAVLERASQELLDLPSDDADCLSDRIFLVTTSICSALANLAELIGYLEDPNRS